MCLHNWPFKQHAYTYIRYFTVGSSVCVPNGANLYRPFQEYDLTSILLTPSSTKTVNETSLSFNLTLHSWSQLSCNLWVRGRNPNEILWCYHSNKSYWVVLSCGTVYVLTSLLLTPSSTKTPSVMGDRMVSGQLLPCSFTVTNVSRNGSALS